MSATAVELGRLWAAYGQIAATILIGAGQIAIVWYGIRAMQRQGQQRSREQDQRHEESMTALKALIERTAPQQESNR